MPAAVRGDSSGDEKFPLGMDGSLIVPANTATVLFGGKVPPNGFTIQLYGNGTPQCIVNDHGPPFNPPGTNGPSGFVIPQTGGAAPLTYAAPHSVSCSCWPREQLPDDRGFDTYRRLARHRRRAPAGAARIFRLRHGSA
jgi:hypothetical protein